MRIVWRTDGIEPSSSWPDETTTGTSGALTAVPGTATSGTGWAWQAGDNYVLVNGTGVTVSDLDVSGPIVVNADNVTVSNCKVTSTDSMGIQVLNADNVTVEDCECAGSGDENSAGQNMVWIDGSNNCTVQRCNLHSGENGIMVSGQDAVIRDNYIHDLLPEDEVPTAHTDGIQLFGGNEADGCHIEGNNVIAPHTFATSALIMGQNVNVTVTGNRWRGAYGTFRPWMDDTNVYTNNRVGDLSEAGGAALVTSNGGTGTPTWSGNVNDDTEEALPPP